MNPWMTLLAGLALAALGSQLLLAANARLHLPPAVLALLRGLAGS